MSIRITSITAAALAVSAVMTGWAVAADFKVTSPNFTDGGTLPMAQVYNSFGCEGGNVSPALEWTGAPEGTKSFAVTAYDPDAPTGSGWWHWVVFDIPADAKGLPEGAGSGQGLPESAVQGRTDFGTPGYGGACPPPGAPHHYVFTVFALNTDKLGVPADASAAMVGFMTGANELARASVTALYGR
jgi:Raf kinase inhibitor-like YbhB/YbcL family protein